LAIRKFLILVDVDLRTDQSAVLDMGHMETIYLAGRMVLCSVLWMLLEQTALARPALF
jgi:hypothetical protein